MEKEKRTVLAGKASTYQLFLKGIKDIYNRLDELERKHPELDHRLERRYSELEPRVEMLDSLKILNRDVAELKQKIASLESAAKGELSSASPGEKGKEAVTTADLFTLPDTLRKAYLALAEIRTP